MFNNYRGQRSFSQTFNVIPMVARRPNLEDGGKIILPPSALERISHLNLVWPLLFELANPKFPDRRTHCGVLEFTAEEGTAYVPLWMMNNIQLDVNDYVKISTRELPRATFIKFQPQSTSFLDITNPKAVLENVLRKYAALSKGDIILFRYNNKDYRLLVLEAKPENTHNAVSVIEVDLNVDFAAPVGYKEPEVAQPMAIDGVSDDEESDSEDEWERKRFVVFNGSGQRISGKPVASSVKTNLAKSPLSQSPSPLDCPLDNMPASPSKFVAFGGKGRTLRD
mmetsp:Transcript_2461/g.2745  ORF Transcript_2461/g.2745 Transcript_2461/m.2745 type:complete len:281 (+) Transcript_2461:41-883(+)